MADFIWRERPGSLARHDLCDGRTGEVLAIVFQDRHSKQWHWQRYLIATTLGAASAGTTDCLLIAKGNVLAGMQPAEPCVEAIAQRD